MYPRIPLVRPACSPQPAARASSDGGGGGEGGGGGMRGDGPECLVDRGAICDTPPPCGGRQGRQGRKGERGQDLTRPCCVALATTRVVE